MFGDPIANPKGWEGEIDFNVSKYIDDRSWKDLTLRCPIELNDILYTTVGSYGNAAKTLERRIGRIRKSV